MSSRYDIPLSEWSEDDLFREWNAGMILEAQGEFWSKEHDEKLTAVEKEMDRRHDQYAADLRDMDIVKLYALYNSNVNKYNEDSEDLSPYFHLIQWEVKARTIKQVIVIRKDLNMRKGKMVAQGAHASMKGVIENMDNIYVKEWLSRSFTKICLSVDSEEEFKAIGTAAHHSGLIVAPIKDNGKTEFNNVPTWTALAIGPAPAVDIDKITGDLKLL